jgi:hypothetical protein
MSDVDTNWPPPDIFPLGRLRPTLDRRQRFWADFWHYDILWVFDNDIFLPVRPVRYPISGWVQAQFDDGLIYFDLDQGFGPKVELWVGGDERSPTVYNPLAIVSIETSPLYVHGPGPFLWEGLFDDFGRDFSRRFRIRVPLKIELGVTQPCKELSIQLNLQGLNTNGPRPPVISEVLQVPCHGS